MSQDPWVAVQPTPLGMTVVNMEGTGPRLLREASPRGTRPVANTSCGALCRAGSLKDSTYLAQTPPLCPKGQDSLKLFWDPRVVTEAWKLGQNTPLFLLLPKEMGGSEQ